MRLTKTTVFDWKTHNKNFIHYLEAIITKDGTVHYAVPSHQEKLVEIYCKERNINRDELLKLIPLTEAPDSWIINELGVIEVWYDFVKQPIDITNEQRDSLKLLRMKGCISPAYNTYEVFKNEYGNINSRLVI